MLRSGRSLSGNERNCCFLNVDGQRFADISAIAGVDFPQDSRAVAVTDWDFDGDLDVWMLNRNRPRVRFLRNETGTNHHFLAIRLTGQSCNRDAIGARLELHLTEPKQTLLKTLHAGHGYATQSSKWLHFGLGDRTRIEKLLVHWPGGEFQEFRELEIDRHLILTQDNDTPRRFEIGKTDGRLAPSTAPLAPTKSDWLRVGLAGKTPLPQLKYRTWDHELRELQFPRQRPLLINLWASWCAPCVKELTDFTSAHRELKAHDLDILALTVDGVRDLDSAALANSKKLIQQLEFPFDSGLVTFDFGEKLRILQRPFIENDDEAVFPTSVLVEPDGSVAAIYQGAVRLSTLLADVDRIHDAGTGPSNLAIEFPGRWRVPPSQRDQLITLAAYFHMADYDQDSLIYSRRALKLDPQSVLAKRNFDFATARVREIDQRLSQYAKEVAASPSNPAGHFNLATARLRQGEIDIAITHFQRAVELDPHFTDAYVNLGSVLARTGDLRQAEAYLRRALDADPSNDLVKQKLAQIAAARKSAIGTNE
jgi:tetratricopeptide (TPR) repeat protein